MAELNEQQQQAADELTQKFGITGKDAEEIIFSIGQSGLITEGTELGKATALLAKEESQAWATTQLHDETIGLINYTGENLVIINYNEVCSPLCRGAQNNIYWVNTPVPGYNKLDDYTVYNKGKVWPKGKSLFHKNCKHWISIYYPGLSDPPVKETLTDEQAEKYYNDVQEYKYLKKNKENWYNKYKVAKENNLDPDDFYKNKYNEWLKRWQYKRNELGDV